MSTPGQQAALDQAAKNLLDLAYKEEKQFPQIRELQRVQREEGDTAAMAMMESLGGPGEFIPMLMDSMKVGQERQAALHLYVTLRDIVEVESL